MLKIILHLPFFFFCGQNCRRKQGLARLRQSPSEALRLKPMGQPVWMSTNKFLLAAGLELRWVRRSVRAVGTSSDFHPTKRSVRMFNLQLHSSNYKQARVVLSKQNLQPFLKFHCHNIKVASYFSLRNHLQKINKTHFIQQPTYSSFIKLTHISCTSLLKSYNFCNVF